MTDSLVLGGGSARRRGGHSPSLPPADAAKLAPLLLIAGAALSITGWMEIGLLWIPPHLGDVDWEFAISATTFEALPVPTIGLLAIAFGLRLRGGTRMFPRAVAVFAVIVAVLCLVVISLFSLTMGPAFGSLADPQLAGGLKRVIGKFYVSSPTYVVTYISIAVFMWRSTSRKVAGQVSPKGSTGSAALDTPDTPD